MKVFSPAELESARKVVVALLRSKAHTLVPVGTIAVSLGWSLLWTERLLESMVTDQVIRACTAHECAGTDLTFAYVLLGDG